MTRWQPLSVRRGRREPAGPVEGVPKYMFPQLHTWILDELRAAFGHDQDIYEVAAAVEFEFTGRKDPLQSLAEAYAADEDLMLDVIDALLQLHWDWPQKRALKEILERRGSVWTVRTDGKGLERRVDVATSEAFQLATTPRDEASTELSEAWRKAYGRDPDASDAWDHAIKAVEAVLGPVASPKNHKPTLGTIIRDLNAKPEKWTFGLQNQGSNLHGTAVLVEMLRFIWPNPDRHAGGATRTPDLPEAQAVLQVAINVVHLVRLGIIK